MTRDDIATERALKMHDLALSVVRSKGVTKLVDVWFGSRVLAVERFAWRSQILRYTPGDWERHLIKAAKVAA